MNLVFRHNRFLIAFLLVCFLLVLGRIQSVFILPNVRISLHEIVMSVMILGSLPYIKQYIHSIVSSRISSTMVMMIVIVSLSLVKPLIQGESIMIGIFYVLRLLLYFGWFVSMLVLLQHAFFSRETVLKSIVLIAGAIGGIGLLQYIFLPDVRFLFAYGWDDHLNRVVSTLFDPPFTASVLGSGLMLLITQPKILSNNARVVYGVASILGFALLLTISRATILAFGITLLIWIVRHALASVRKKGFFIGLCILAIATFSMLFFRSEGEGTQLFRTASVIARIKSTTDQLAQVQGIDHLVGNGWYLSQQHRVNSTDESIPSHSSGADNLFVHLYVSTGVLGLVALGALSVRLIAELRRVSSISTRYVLAFLLLASQINLVLLFPWILWIVATMVATDVSKQFHTKINTN